MAKIINYKKLPIKTLRRMFSGVDFGTKPRRHQLVTFAFGLDQNRCRVYLMHGIGTGKTLTALYLMQLYGAKRILVIAPAGTIRKTWKPEIKKHTDLKYCILDGNTEERKRKLRTSKARIFVTNYEGLMWIFGEKKKLDKRGKHGKFVAVENNELINFDGLIVDEAHHMSSIQAVSTQIGGIISYKAKFVILMSGSPYGRSFMDLWAQYWVLDQGKTLGETFEEFRKEHFNGTLIKPRNPFQRGHYWMHWDIKEGADKKILKRVAPVTIRFSRKECWDIPQEVYESRTALPTLKQSNLMEAIRKSLTRKVAKGKKLKAASLVNHLMRLRQITGGFTTVEDKRGREEIVRFHSPKLDLLLEVVQEIDEKFIVFHTFVEEGRIIEDALRKAKIKFRSLRGEIKDKDRQYREFRKYKDIQGLVAHPKCGGEGINVPEASVVIFYSLPSLREYQQAVGRVLRPDQKKKCVIIHLLLEGTVDEAGSENLKENKAIEKEVLLYMQNFIHRSKAK